MSELQYLLNWMYVFIVCLIGMTIGALGSYYMFVGIKRLAVNYNKEKEK